MHVTMRKDEIKCIKCFPEISTHSLPPHTKEMNEHNKHWEEGWDIMTSPNNTSMNSVLPMLILD